MSMASAKDGDDPQHEADRQARAMNDGLRKDVKAWSAARSGTASRAADEFGVPPAVPPSPARRVKKAKPVVEAKPAPAIGKPFRMSYDGVTTTEHIAERLARGAR